VRLRSLLKKFGDFFCRQDYKAKERKQSAFDDELLKQDTISLSSSKSRLVAIECASITDKLIKEENSKRKMI